MGDRGSVGMRIQRMYAVVIGVRVFGYVKANVDAEALVKARRWAKQQGFFTRNLAVHYLPHLRVPEKS